MRNGLMKTTHTVAGIRARGQSGVEVAFLSGDEQPDGSGPSVQFANNPAPLRPAFALSRCDSLPSGLGTRAGAQAAMIRAASIREGGTHASRVLPRPSAAARPLTSRKTPALLARELEAVGELLPDQRPQNSAMNAIAPVLLNRFIDRIAQLAIRSGGVFLRHRPGLPEWTALGNSRVLFSCGVTPHDARAHTRA